MRRTAKLLACTACTLMTLLGVVAGLVVAGDAFADLETWLAVTSTALWLVPTVALSVFALRWPGTAAPVLVGLAVVAGLVSVLDAAFHLVAIDALGPVVAIGVFAVAVSLGFLGLHREALSGLLLVFLGVAQFLATVLGRSGGADLGPGPRVSDLLMTPSGVVIVPIVVVGLLYLTAGTLDHEPPGLRPVGPTTRVAH